MQDVMVCKNCKRLAVNVIKGLCPDCVKRLEEKFPEVKAYVYENPGATVNEVAEACDVSSRQLIRWVKEERLEIVSNDGLILCEGCGKRITKGRYCGECKKVMVKTLEGIKTGKTEAVPDHDGDRMRFLR